MLGVQIYYARAISPAHLLYPLRLASFHFQNIPDIKPSYNSSRQEESKKRIAITLGASRGRKIERSTGYHGTNERIPPLASFCIKFYLFFAALGCGAYFLAPVGVVTSVLGCWAAGRLPRVSQFWRPKAVLHAPDT
ncbi:hypothetical protein M9H77_06886 [Catharanthus roseus]|uniref:Uncharacterized protein n=1 Tax=Catharanthus roseus TaxID=4058 RepID=A0ACC0BTG4_CATRO|nr:hypothetical protein M9H77_06886 [Catharanthus roseus]